MLIDIHTHLGDILEPGGAALIARRGLRYPRGAILRLDDRLLYRRAPISRLLAKMVPWQISREERARNRAGTLENAVASVDILSSLDVRRGGDGKSCACVMPIAPHITFWDLLPVIQQESRLHAFGSPDFTLGSPGTEEDLAQQAQAGAAGLKFHPIIQKVRWNDDAFLRALEAWQSVAPGRPVLAHTGLSSYYPPEQRDRERPEYSDPAGAAKTIAAFPRIPFILGHAGLFEEREWAEACAGLPNAFIDGSFQGPAQLRRLAVLYGEERLLFASDWPYGVAKTAFLAAKAAFRGEALERMLWKNAQGLLQIPK